MIPFKKQVAWRYHPTILKFADGQVLRLGSGVSYPCRQKQQTTVGCCVELPGKSTLQFHSDHMSLCSEAPCSECEFLVSNLYVVDQSVET